MDSDCKNSIWSKIGAEMKSDSGNALLEHGENNILTVVNRKHFEVTSAGITVTSSHGVKQVKCWMYEVYVDRRNETRIYWDERRWNDFAKRASQGQGFVCLWTRYNDRFRFYG
ncbi:uncharacterized protein LOC119653981 [Hermetia illucens]|uniref:uncharacterized protein LOC119653981 n=1 Tax=Hermetia illucens TaxID=343691 RepID=UPI0018CC5366|nr:uncharacterized protein LOC119653981 [Hermetia illucens]